ncbi:MAG: Acetyltransferase [Devosia sp.]|nr:Acetyltransferase [Devosia sp.]
MQILTDRLLLRPLRDDDRAVNAEIFADPTVRRFALSVLEPKAANARLDRFMAEHTERGFGMLAAEDRRDGSFIGVIGLTGFGAVLKAAIPSQPSLQIAWQLATRVWGQGLATEGARAVLDHAWTALHETEVVAVTASINMPSRRVMEKIGMHHEPSDDFLSPDFPKGHPLEPHVLYQIRGGPPLPPAP